MITFLKKASFPDVKLHLREISYVPYLRHGPQILGSEFLMIAQFRGNCDHSTLSISPCYRDMDAKAQLGRWPGMCISGTVISGSLQLFLLGIKLVNYQLLYSGRLGYQAELDMMLSARMIVMIIRVSVSERGIDMLT
jgi:hypothetical protein